MDLQSLIALYVETQTSIGKFQMYQDRLYGVGVKILDMTKLSRNRRGMIVFWICVLVGRRIKESHLGISSFLFQIIKALLSILAVKRLSRGGLKSQNGK